MTQALSVIANKYPVLSEFEELELAKRYQDTNDLEAAHKLALHHIPLVMKVANRYKGYGIPLEDLQHEGFIGLLKAIKKFDYRRGVRLMAFAVYDIKYSIGEYVLKNYRLVNITTTKDAIKLFWNREVVNKDIDVLETLNVTQKQLDNFEAKYAGKESSIDVDSTSLMHLPSDFKTPEQHIEDRDDLRQVEALKAAVATLDERTQVVIIGRYLTEPPKKLREIAEELGVSAQRVEQIERKALKELKDVLKLDNALN